MKITATDIIPGIIDLSALQRLSDTGVEADSFKVTLGPNKSIIVPDKYYYLINIQSALSRGWITIDGFSEEEGESYQIITPEEYTNNYSYTKVQIINKPSYPQDAFTKYNENFEKIDSRLKNNCQNIDQKANISGQIFTGEISATNLSGINTGDETKNSIEIKLQAANGTNNGYLSSADWNIFSNASSNVAGQNHSLLDNLDYSNSGHTGFQQEIGYITENINNKSNNSSLGLSSDLYPTQAAVKTYVDDTFSNVSSNYLKLDGSNGPLTGDLNTNENIYIDTDSKKLYFGGDNDYYIEWNGSNATHTISSGDFVFDGGDFNIGTYDKESDTVLSLKTTTETDTYLKFRESSTNGFNLHYNGLSNQFIIERFHNNVAYESMIFNRGSGNVSLKSKLQIIGNDDFWGAASYGTGGIFELVTGTGAPTDNKLIMGVDSSGNSWMQAVDPYTSWKNIILNGSGGNVGINEASPSQSLVVKSIISDQGIILNNSGGAATITLNASGANDANIRIQNDGSNKVQFGWDQSQNSFRIYGYTGTVPCALIWIDTTDGNIRIPANNQRLYFGAAQNYYIQWDGSDAKHTISAGDFVFDGGNMAINRTSTSSVLHVTSRTDSGSGAFRVDGIPHSSGLRSLCYFDPGSQDMNAGGDYVKNAILRMDVNGISNWNIISVVDDGVQKFRLSQTGSMQMEESGTGGYYSTSSHDWITGSSLEMLKTEIEDYSDDALQIAKKINVRKYRYRKYEKIYKKAYDKSEQQYKRTKVGEKEIEPDEECLGYIAEELPKELPEAVITKNGNLSVKGGFAFLLKGIQQLTEIKEQQQKEIDSLEDQIKNLKREIEKI